MISTRLRDALSAVAMLVLVGGPILSAVAFMVVAVEGGSRPGFALGNAMEFFFGSLIAGGMLRLMTSIDARLEARG